MTEFAKRVENLLELQDKRKSDIVHSLNIADSTVRSWWAKDSIPAADVALKVAKFLGVSLEYLLTGRKESAPQSPPLSLPANVATEDLKDLRSIAETYPRLSSSQKQMIMACLKAASETSM